MLKSRHQAQLSLRLKFHDEARLGPGKIALLEAVNATGSVAQAGATMKMSARRAWLLIDSLNNAFKSTLVAVADPATPGESEASLTTLGEQLVDAYRAAENDSIKAVDERFKAIIPHLLERPDQAGQA